MQKMKVEDIQKNLPTVLTKIEKNGDRVIIQRNGKNIAAIISFPDYEAVERIENIVDLQEADSALMEAEREGVIDFNDYIVDEEFLNEEKFEDDEYGDSEYNEKY